MDKKIVTIQREKVISGQDFKDVQLRQYPTNKELESAIIDDGVIISGAALTIVRNIEISPVVKQLRLCAKSGRDLGFSTDMPSSIIFRCAFERGFRESSLEAIAISRIGSVNENHVIGATKHFIGPGGYRQFLALVNLGGKLELSALDDHPSKKWHPDVVWLLENVLPE